MWPSDCKDLAIIDVANALSNGPLSPSSIEKALAWPEVTSQELIDVLLWMLDRGAVAMDADRKLYIQPNWAAKMGMGPQKIEVELPRECCRAHFREDCHRLGLKREDPKTLPCVYCDEYDLT